MRPAQQSATAHYYPVCVCLCVLSSNEEDSNSAEECVCVCVRFDINVALVCVQMWFQRRVNVTEYTLLLL